MITRFCPRSGALWRASIILVLVGLAATVAAAETLTLEEALALLVGQPSLRRALGANGRSSRNVPSLPRLPYTSSVDT